MGRRAKIAIGVVAAVVGLGVVLLLSGEPEPRGPTDSAVVRRPAAGTRGELPRPERVAPSPAPATAANFVLEIVGPGGGSPGRCWLQLKNTANPVSGRIDDGRERGTFTPGPLTAHASCVEGFGRGTFDVPDLNAKLTLEPNAVLSVDVAWSDGRPAAGIEVAAQLEKTASPWFERFADEDVSGQLRIIRRLTTPEGHAELTFPPASIKVTATEGRTAVYSGAAGADPRGVAPSQLVPDQAPGARGLTRVSATADLRSDPVQHLKLTLPAGRALSGTVVDEAHQAVAGLELKAINPAQVNAGTQVTVTDGSGRFFFRSGLPPTVRLDGERVTAVVAPGTDTVALVQRQKRLVDGRAISKAGLPQAGVTIDGLHPTAADGAFSFETEPWEDRHTFEFQRGAARKLVTVELLPGVTHLGDVTLDPAP